MQLAALGHILYDIRCYVDTFPKPDKTAIVHGHMKHSVGGSATNVAANAAKLGLRSAILGKVGFDERGKYALSQLQSIGVDCSGVRIERHQSTGVAFVIIDKKGIPSVVEFVGANEPFDSQSIEWSVLKRAEHLHLSGTSLPALEAASSAVKARGASVSFDPGRAFSKLGIVKLAQVLRHTDYLILNRTEISNLAGMSSHLRAIKTVRKKFSQLTVVVKGGSQETLLASPHEAFAIKTLPVSVRDTIGAGDAFSAGFLSGVLDKAQLAEAVKYGNVCGAMKVMHEGANGLPFRTFIDDFFRHNHKKLTQKKVVL